MTAAASSRWCVVQTHVHAEAKAAAHLLRQGYDIYLPRYLKRRRHARRVEDVHAPLFPRYLFVGFDRQAVRWRSIQSTQGVSHLICHSNEPALLPESVIAELRRREGDNGLIRPRSAAAICPRRQGAGRRRRVRRQPRFVRRNGGSRPRRDPARPAGPQGPGHTRSGIRRGGLASAPRFSTNCRDRVESFSPGLR